MCHKLTAEISSNQVHFEWRKVEIIAYQRKELLYPLIQAETALAWSEQDRKS